MSFETRVRKWFYGASTPNVGVFRSIVREGLVKNWLDDREVVDFWCGCLDEAVLLRLVQTGDRFASSIEPTFEILDSLPGILKDRPLPSPDLLKEARVHIPELPETVSDYPRSSVLREWDNGRAICIGQTAFPAAGPGSYFYQFYYDESWGVASAPQGIFDLSCTETKRYTERYECKAYGTRDKCLLSLPDPKAWEHLYWLRCHRHLRIFEVPSFLGDLEFANASVQYDLIIGKKSFLHDLLVHAHGERTPRLQGTCDDLAKWIALYEKHYISKGKHSRMVEHMLGRCADSCKHILDDTHHFDAYCNNTIQEYKQAMLELAEFQSLVKRECV